MAPVQGVVHTRAMGLRHLERPIGGCDEITLREMKRFDRHYGAVMRAFPVVVPKREVSRCSSIAPLLGR
jgi:hypothetical protein